jgi:Putative glycosyl/glycerophosphate transferases involved in teichoic acid biosynthesis TagF/TagB/EpsJ/RodC
LMLAIDIGITDYSSWIYDYILTRKAGFIFAPDLDVYDDFRGFYYPIDETPFPISRSNAELVKQIKKFNNEKYQKKIDKFLIERGCFEKGDASKRTVEKIKELMQK